MPGVVGPAPRARCRSAVAGRCQHRSPHRHAAAAVRRQGRVPGPPQRAQPWLHALGQSRHLAVPGARCRVVEQRHGGDRALARQSALCRLCAQPRRHGHCAFGQCRGILRAGDRAGQSPSDASGHRWLGARGAQCEPGPLARSSHRQRLLHVHAQGCAGGDRRLRRRQVPARLWRGERFLHARAAGRLAQPGVRQGLRRPQAFAEFRGGKDRP